MRKAMYIEQDKADELERYKLKSGDFLFSRMASVGRAAIVEDELAGNIFNYHLMRLRLDDKWIEPKYFLYYVQGSVSVSQYVKKVNHGATRDGINTKQLSYMPVALPCLQEQRKIVECIETYWNVINEIEDLLKKDFNAGSRRKKDPKWVL